VSFARLIRGPLSSDPVGVCVSVTRAADWSWPPASMVSLVLLLLRTRLNPSHGNGSLQATVPAAADGSRASPKSLSRDSAPVPNTYPPESLV
jgi:hypothetical protein